MKQPTIDESDYSIYNIEYIYIYYFFFSVLDLESFQDANRAVMSLGAATTQNNVVVSPVDATTLSPTIPLGAARINCQHWAHKSFSELQSRIQHLEPYFSFVCDIGPVVTSVSSAIRVPQNTRTSCMLLQGELMKRRKLLVVHEEVREFIYRMYLVRE